MAITGHLADFALLEIFKFLEKGQKTGLLTVHALPTAQPGTVQAYYIWLHQGRIVAAANCLDNKRLMLMIAQRWLSDRVISKVAQSSPPNTPLGLCLQSQGLIQAEQLKLIFRIQVLEQLCTLFRLRDGQFKFETQVSLPAAEMTGLSLPATEAILAALRILRDWNVLAEELPDPTSTLLRLRQPHLRLDPLEWQVWELSNKNIPLQEIAKAIEVPVVKVQQIAFRLVAVNLAKEIFMTASLATAATTKNTSSDIVKRKTYVR